MTLTQWAIKHGVSHVAIAELTDIFTGEACVEASNNAKHGSEAWVSSQVKLEGADKGVKLMRNNVGVLTDKNGRPVRFGLANDSKQMNTRIKSGDYIGVRPVTITLDMVGHVIGQFVSREIKEAGWTYSGQGREVAQMRWVEFINGLGGDACFASGVGTL